MKAAAQAAAFLYRAKNQTSIQLVGASPRSGKRYGCFSLVRDFGPGSRLCLSERVSTTSNLSGRSLLPEMPNESAAHEQVVLTARVGAEIQIGSARPKITKFAADAEVAE